MLTSSIRRIAIVYCSSLHYDKERSKEEKADCEINEVARAVQISLMGKGYQAEIINLDPAKINDLPQYDWVYNLAETIHGFPLVDYEVANEMEKLGIRFTGSNSMVLKTCEDKAETKRILLDNGIKTPDYEVVYPGNKAKQTIPFPVIVKPVHEDGSIGISWDSVAKNRVDLGILIDRIHDRYRQAALIEEYIDGRDINASILGNGIQTTIFPLSENVYQEFDVQKYLTFEAKWIPDSIDYSISTVKCPCDLDPDIEEKIKAIALKVNLLLGCRDYTRVDFRLRNNEPFVLEVNPNPCINPDNAGYILSAKAAGLTYDDTIHQILLSSIRNYLKISEMLSEEVVL